MKGATFDRWTRLAATRQSRRRLFGLASGAALARFAGPRVMLAQDEPATANIFLDLAFLSPQPWDFSGSQARDLGMSFWTPSLDQAISQRAISENQAEILGAHGFVALQRDAFRNEDDPAGSAPSVVTSVIAQHSSAADAGQAVTAMQTGPFATVQRLAQTDSGTYYTFQGQQSDGTPYQAVTGLAAIDRFSVTITEYFPGSARVDPQQPVDDIDVVLLSIGVRFPQISPPGQSLGLWSSGRDLIDSAIAGTTMAAPQSSGLAALLRSYYSVVDGVRVPLNDEPQEERSAARRKYRSVDTGYAEIALIGLDNQPAMQLNTNLYTFPNPDAASEFFESNLADFSGGSGAVVTMHRDEVSSALAVVLGVQHSGAASNEMYRGYVVRVLTGHHVGQFGALSLVPVQSANALPDGAVDVLESSARSMAAAYAASVVRSTGQPPMIWDLDFNEPRPMTDSEIEQLFAEPPPPRTSCRFEFVFDELGWNGPGCYACPGPPDSTIPIFQTTLICIEPVTYDTTQHRCVDDEGDPRDCIPNFEPAF
jgi:hypothetical protein